MKNDLHNIFVIHTPNPHKQGGGLGGGGVNFYPSAQLKVMVDAAAAKATPKSGKWAKMISLEVNGCFQEKKVPRHVFNVPNVTEQNKLKRKDMEKWIKEETDLRKRGIQRKKDPLKPPPPKKMSLEPQEDKWPEIDKKSDKQQEENNFNGYEEDDDQDQDIEQKVSQTQEMNVNDQEEDEQLNEQLDQEQDQDSNDEKQNLNLNPPQDQDEEEQSQQEKEDIQDSDQDQDYDIQDYKKDEEQNQNQVPEEDYQQEQLQNSQQKQQVHQLDQIQELQDLAESKFIDEEIDENIGGAPGQNQIASSIVSKSQMSSTYSLKGYKSQVADKMREMMFELE